MPIDEDDDLLVKRYQRKKQKQSARKRFLLIGLGVLVAGGIASAVAVAYGRRTTTRDWRGQEVDTNDANNWTTRQLVDFLSSNGMKWEMSRGKYFAEVQGTAFEKIMILEDAHIEPGGLIEFNHCHSEEGARQMAGSLLKGTYAYKSWCFSGDEGMLRKIRTAFEKSRP